MSNCVIMLCTYVTYCILWSTNVKGVTSKRLQLYIHSVCVCVIKNLKAEEDKAQVWAVVPSGGGTFWQSPIKLIAVPKRRNIAGIRRIRK
jgi:hypothetical protein